MSTTTTNSLRASASESSGRPLAGDVSFSAEEQLRARRYPISRWYLRPAAGWLARVLESSPVRPSHLTACGLIAASVSAAVLLWRPELAPLAAAGVLAAWLFDRADGLLARCQQSQSSLGAWLDANVDELIDVGLHVAVAAAGAAGTASRWPWFLLIGFLAGKYLLMYGLAVEEHARGVAAVLDEDVEDSRTMGRLRLIYHLPGNADVRVHLLVAALLGGWLTAELAFVAVYYNLRWVARYVLVARRLGGAQ